MPACPKQSSPVVKAGIYTRISSDPSGQRAGVERQRADCEERCLARGWEVNEVFCGNDVSAYGRKPRLAEATTKQRIVLQPNPRAFWAEADLHQRRDLVRMMVDRITIMPGRPGVPHFDPSRVRIDATPCGRVTVQSVAPPV